MDPLGDMLLADLWIVLYRTESEHGACAGLRFGGHKWGKRWNSRQATAWTSEAGAGALGAGEMLNEMDAGAAAPAKDEKAVTMKDDRCRFAGTDRCQGGGSAGRCHGRSRQDRCGPRQQKGQ